MDSPGRPVAFSAVRLGEWTRLEQGAFAKWMVGSPAHSGDTNRPGNTRNGFGGLTLSPSLGGRVFGSPFLALLCLCVLAARRLSRFSGRGFRRPYASRKRYPDNLCRLPLVWFNFFRI